MNNTLVALYGIHPIQELLRAKQRTIQKLFTTNPPPKVFTTIAPLVPRHISVTFCSREKLTALAGTDDHQGVVALVTPLPTRKSCFNIVQHPYILMLDGIQDPRNLGAIIRSAYCTAVDGIVIPHKQSAPLTAVVCKAAAGLIEHSTIYQPPSSIAAIQEIQAAGYAIYCAAAGGTDIRTLSFTVPTCIVIGSEGTGITAPVRSYGTAIAIPQRNTHLSYNASVAAGIILLAVSSALKRL